jgi:hypothetical protein
MFDASPREIVAEAVWVGVWHVGATPQHRQQVADATVGLWTALARKIGPSARTGQMAFRASRTAAFNGTRRALSPLPP